MQFYPQNLESKIGFDSIREYLSSYCQSPLGKKEVDSMCASSDKSFIIKALNETNEMKGILENEEELPYTSFNELSNWLILLKTEGTYASPAELLSLKKSLISFSSVRNFYTRTQNNEPEGKTLYPYLSSTFIGMGVFPQIIRSIDDIIDNLGSVKSSCSLELSEVRQQLSGLEGAVSRSIQKAYAHALKEGFTDKDTAPTFRNGRTVIPVNAGNKRNIPGIVHDESATGKTVYIEPAETVELNNRIRELEIEEQRIIVKILITLTDIIRPHIDDIQRSNLLMGKLDFIMSKAKFALDIGASLPTISNKPEIDWYGAIHPALFFNLKRQGKEIVPLNLRLEGKNRILLISGPNAGGKSIALKTAGIIQYMFQSGILPSLYSNSHMGIFNKLFIDIGDEQSIENNLSTYSSHLKNMRYFLLHTDKRSLILIDEIGSGTEPNIGASLAKAILADLSKTQCYGIITTHYHKLKQFAEETPGFINGAMMYDRQHLQPTFQLSVGTAGSSFALEIAGKIGLPKSIIDTAKADVGEDYVGSEKFLMEIARDKKYWQNKRLSIKERENKLLKLEAQYSEALSELTNKRKEVLKEAQEEAKELLSGANKKIEKTIAEIRKIEADKEKTKVLRKNLSEFKESIDQVEEKNFKLKSKIKPIIKAKFKNKGNDGSTEVNVNENNQNCPLKTGDYVKMSTSTSVGRILSINNKEAEVAFGGLRTRVSLSKLKRAQAPSNNIGDSSYNLISFTNNDSSRERQLAFVNELDIRGKRADEALDILTHYIDDAVQFGVKRVRILHGTGSGILRQLVRQQLFSTSGIAKFEDEDVRFGGAGITVVTLI